MNDEMVMTLEEIQDLRRRYLAGEEVSREELKRALQALRANRAATADRNGDALKGKSLDELLGL